MKLFDRIEDVSKDKFRFILVGLMSNIINFVIYEWMYYIFNSLTIASVIGYTSGLYISYCFARTWVFGKVYGTELRRKILFVIVYVIGLVLMTAIIGYMSNSLLIDYQLSWLCGGCVAMINNYLGTKHIVFR
jgi:putative flippase GtrA